MERLYDINVANKLNKIASSIKANLTYEEKMEIFETLYWHWTDNVEDIIDLMESENYTTYSDCFCEEDVAWCVIEETSFLDELPSKYIKYFDISVFLDELKNNFFIFKYSVGKYLIIWN